MLAQLGLAAGPVVRQRRRQQITEVMAVIDPRSLLGIDVRRRDPFGAARILRTCRCDAGLPAAGPVVHQRMTRVAGEILVGDVGGSTVPPFGDVMDGGECRGGVAAG